MKPSKYSSTANRSTKNQSSETTRNILTQLHLSSNHTLFSWDHNSTRKRFKTLTHFSFSSLVYVCVCVCTLENNFAFQWKLFDGVRDLKFMMLVVFNCHRFCSHSISAHQKRYSFNRNHVPIIELNFIRPMSIEIRIGGRVGIKWSSRRQFWGSRFGSLNTKIYFDEVVN